MKTKNLLYLKITFKIKENGKQKEGGREGKRDRGVALFYIFTTLLNV